MVVLADKWKLTVELTTDGPITENEAARRVRMEQFVELNPDELRVLKAKPVNDSKPQITTQDYDRH